MPIQFVSFSILYLFIIVMVIYAVYVLLSKWITYHYETKREQNEILREIAEAVKHWAQK